MGITINDMLDQCVTFQGQAHISYFDLEGHNVVEHVMFEGDLEDELFFNQLYEDWMNWPVTFIWAGAGRLNIELEKE